MSVRGVLIAAASALLACGAVAAGAAGAADPATRAVVTAHPPLEAVPATPGARAQQTRLRRCATAARAKQLRGAARDSYVRSCTASPHPAPAKPAR